MRTERPTKRKTRTPVSRVSLTPKNTGFSPGADVSDSIRKDWREKKRKKEKKGRKRNKGKGKEIEGREEGDEREEREVGRKGRKESEER